MLTRRELLKLVGAAAAVAATPLPIGCGPAMPPPPPPPAGFFDAHQRATIDVLTGFVLPSEPGAPGAREAVAVGYIDNMLSAFDVMPPRIFAGGPASARNAIPDAHGAATTVFPPNAFATFLPLSRVQEIAWRMRLFGTAATVGGDFNDAVLGAKAGLRDLYLGGIAALDAAAAARVAGMTFVDLSAADQAAVYSALVPDHGDFVHALIEHTIEGTFAAPEYGGNTALVGWTLARWDGDSVPRGHSFYDESLGAYVDRPDQPTSTPTPGDVSEDYDPVALRLLSVAALGSGGMMFF